MGRLFEVVGSRGCIDMGIGVHDTVASVISTHRRRRHRAVVFNQIEDQIDALRSHVTTQNDISLWKCNIDKFKAKFSSNETWVLLRESSPICSWYKGVWFPQATPKYTFLTWLATRNRLATGDRVSRWNVDANTSCVFCKDELETRDHLFFSCSYCSQVWSSIARGILQNDFTTQWDQILLILSDSTRPKLITFAIRYSFQATVHSLWRERNGR